MLKYLAVLVVISFYLYPTLRTRVELGPMPLAPVFAPDLSMYLNLSEMPAAGEGRILNPYYRIPVPANGSGYLKFRVAPRLFGAFNHSLHDHLWFALLVWNLLCWALLCGMALWFFEHFLPGSPSALSIIGLGLLMLFNFGVLKTVALAWIHLPSLAGFRTLALPFMRAFIPVIPVALLVAYVGLQMKAQQEKTVRSWIAMALVQLLALVVFPYATLMMAGLTAISVLFHIRIGEKQTWITPIVYGVACALLDGAFVWHSSLGFYENHTSPVHFQPQLLPKLIGGNWLLMVGLTAGTAVSRKLPPAVRWTLVGLGATNLLLMLGDVVVPASTILLSHHADHFVHTTIAILATFLLASAFAGIPDKIWIRRGILALSLVMVILTGALLALGNYQGALAANREIVELARLQEMWKVGEGDLLIARSKDADDVCGWMVLLSKAPTLFCTDAEVMLTPQQNRDIQRFREAVYLYLTGSDSSSLQRALAKSDPSRLMYRLGYWAEATSLSADERDDGIRAIQTELVPWLDRVQGHDAMVIAFFRNSRRIIVVDDHQDHAFVTERLDSFLRLQAQQQSGNWLLLFYAPK
ncbi:MAG TPA: hypothetical protein VKQ11_07530 [Candidatus Sulfotelmatobacter sp.]|nr:hypothetical protein [Candidatus Sulfotelmatobacter sp.]